MKAATVCPLSLLLFCSVFLFAIDMLMLHQRVLTSQSSFLFLQIESLSLTFHGHDLIVDSELELNYGRFIFCKSEHYFILHVH